MQEKPQVIALTPVVQVRCQAVDLIVDKCLSNQSTLRRVVLHSFVSTGLDNYSTLISNKANVKQVCW